jgi:hypothetical protein
MKTQITPAGRLGRESNPGPHKYEVGVLTTRPRRSLCAVKYDALSRKILVIFSQQNRPFLLYSRASTCSNW